MSSKTKPLDNFYLGKKRIPIKLPTWNKKNIEKVVENMGELIITGDCSYYDEFGNLQHLPYAAKAFEYAEQYKEQLRQQKLPREYRPNLLFSNPS